MKKKTKRPSHARTARLNLRIKSNLDSKLRRLCAESESSMREIVEAALLDYFIAKAVERNAPALERAGIYVGPNAEGDE